MHTDEPTSAYRATAQPATTRGRPRLRRWLARGLIALACVVVLSIVATQIRRGPDNPAFPLTEAQARAELARMQTDPVGLPRPLVVLSGYRSPSGAASMLASRLARATGADRQRDILVVSYPWDDTIEGLGQRVVAAVEARWPSADAAQTIEVDVVAISMGGLVARLAAMPAEDQAALIRVGTDSVRSAPRANPADSDSAAGPTRNTGQKTDSTKGPASALGPSQPGKRLHIARLFTLASPHRGAILAESVALDPAARAMRPGSAFLDALDAAFDDRDADTTYDIIPYAVLHDRWVGAQHASPKGYDPIWVSGRASLSHHLVSTETRLIADLAARLRSEPALAQPAPAPRD